MQIAQHLVTTGWGTARTEWAEFLVQQGVSASMIGRIHQIIRFAAVGLCATAVHTLIFTALVGAGLSGILSNLLSFSVAWCVSFFGHARFTFEVSDIRFDQSRRFLATSVIGLISNSIIAFLIVDYLVLNPWIAVLLMITVTPVMVFVLLKTWVFG